MARKVKFDFNPYKMAGVKPKGSTRSVKAAVKREVKASIRSDLSGGRSPVAKDGKRQGMPRLDRDYAKAKKGGSTTPNLQLTEKMLKSMTVKAAPRGGDWLRLTVSEAQQKKADGHNDFTGKSKLKRRPFVPDANKSESFRSGIEKRIKKIVKGS